MTRDSEAVVFEEAIGTILAGKLYVPALVAVMETEPRGASIGAVQLLTERQREVLVLVAAGHSNKDIGRTLRIAEGTVKIHVTAAFRQLGVNSRAGATRMLGNGIVAIADNDSLRPTPLRWPGPVAALA